MAAIKKLLTHSLTHSKQVNAS